MSTPSGRPKNSMWKSENVPPAVKMTVSPRPGIPQDPQPTQSASVRSLSADQAFPSGSVPALPDPPQSTGPAVALGAERNTHRTANTPSVLNQAFIELSFQEPVQEMQLAGQSYKP